MQPGDLVRRTYMFFPSLGPPRIGVVLFTYGWGDRGFVRVACEGSVCDWELGHCEVVSERR